ncbi:MAG TPA: TrkH family potassium uptake protein [Gammaproteobacteria bacterium]|nr:TrkH family potassium uptake protein [Gammaproteobacteria bacterium]
MNYGFVQRIMGLLLLLLSATMLFPIGIALLYDDGGLWPFVEAGVTLLLLGLVIWFPVRKIRRDLRLRDGFIIVAMFWLVLGFASAIPLVLADQPVMSLTDAVFEAVSGLTTTGATVLLNLDTLPHSILWYRSQLHWLGGMGIIVLAVAILPMLGVGGMQLYKAEAPGPVKDNKITPRITQTAKALWVIYLALTFFCGISYWLGGMGVFDAVTHSFSTIATGGFSTHDASFAYFQSPLLEWIAIFFMILGGINFALHFMAWRHISLKAYLQDPECRTYFGILIALSVITAFYLLFSNTYSDVSTAIRTSIFQVVAIITTTGFVTTNYSLWPVFVPTLLLFAMFIGGCGGSTSGGIKVIRFYLLFKQGMREIKKLIHPNAVLSIKMGDRPVPDTVVESVWGFFAIYVALFVLMMLIMIATGLDQVTAFSAVASALNNFGVGLGEIFVTFATVSDVGKWVSIFAMLLGRLEIFTLLVLLTPAFWRH